MAQQQQNVLFAKPTDSSQKELSQQLQEVSESNKELEDKLTGLEGKLSIAEQEKARLQKVCVSTMSAKLRAVHHNLSIIHRIVAVIFNL